MEEALTEKMLRDAMRFDDSFPQKRYYPIQPKMWDSFIGLGYTEKRLTDWGFIKTAPLNIRK